METCPSCGAWASFEVADVCLDTREVLLDACCEANLEGWLETIASWSRKERSRWMFLQTGIFVKDIIMTGDVLSWTLDYGLRLEAVSFADAKDFIRAHHRHCAPPVGWRYGAAVLNGREMAGLMTAGRPVAAALDRQGCIEINRVCVKDSTPRVLVENACSMLYGYACRQAFKRGYQRVVTYTLTGEAGVSLRAAGFVPVAQTQDGSWDRASRPRIDRSPTIRKIRWERWRDSATLPTQRRLPLAA